MKSRKYWTKRFEEIEKSSNRIGLDTYSQIEPAFLQAQRSIQSEIDSWYVRFAANNKVTIQDARRMLSRKELDELKWDVNQFIKYGEQNALDKQWMKELENASARFHISKLEALKLRTQQAMEVAFGNELDAVDKMARKILTEDYYKSIFEIQKGFSVGFDIGQIDERKLNLLVNKPWATDGKNFSSRIWERKRQMVSELQQELTRTLIQGKSPDEAIQHMEKFVQGKVKNARNAAGRLVMTEQAYFHSVSQKEAFNELDVEEFEIVATLDSHTSEICQQMDGQHFPMDEYSPGVTAPPFHVYCRSVTCPYFNDEWSIGEIAARSEDGETYYVPSNITYPEWKSGFVDGGSKGELKKVKTNDIIESVEVISELNKLKASGISDDEYSQYLGMINNHSNTDIKNLYSKHADEISEVKFTASKGAAYSPNSNSLTFNFNNYNKYPDIDKYGTLAHEYGHFFDAQISFDNIHFKEMEAVRNTTGLDAIFKNVASSSDEFLEAIRKDKEHIKVLITPEVKADLIKNDASHGVQDAIDGLFTKSRIKWGHGEKYYNRKYADIEFLDKIAGTSRKKELQKLYNDMGFDASNQTKVKNICRQYEAASEAWANIMSAEICGGKDLEYVKKYLPNSYKAMLEILKGVK